jgi:hypothetical protein
MALKWNQGGVAENGEDVMSAVMGLLAQVQEPEPVELYNLLAALLLAGLVAKAIVAVIRALITVFALAFGTLILFAFLTEVVLRH